jgi:hypothetical protein
MKSIKQQYIDLKEGKMSQANFMRNLRMTIPQHVTNVTSFGDAVRILKNKGIINESFNPAQDAENAKYKSPMDRMYNSDDYVKAQKDEKGSDDDAEFDAILKQLEDEMGGEEAVKGQYDVNEVELTVRQVIDKFEELLSKNPNAKVEDLAKTLNTTPHELAKIIGIPNLYSAKPAMNETKEVVNPNKIHPQEYTMGMKYELQCFNGDKKKAEKAVLKNLTKDSFYYTVLKLSGNDVHREKATKPEVVVKKKKAVKPELVDKANGMAKVKMPKIVKEELEINPQGGLQPQGFPVAADVDRILKFMKANKTFLSLLKNLNSIKEFTDFFRELLQLTDVELDALKVSDTQLQSIFRKAVLDKRKEDGVPNQIFSKNANIQKGINDIGGIKEADVPQDDKVEAELASALSQQPTLKRILQKVDLPQEVNGTVKAILDRTNLKNIPDQIILAALRKVLNDQPGPSFTSQYAINKTVGKPLPDLKEKLTALVREMLAEEAPSKKTAASEITAKAVDYIDDYNEGEGKEYKKSQLENVFDSYEDKVGRRFDDSVFEDVIDMLKAKGYTMGMKEFYDGRDNLDAENEVN